MVILNIAYRYAFSSSNRHKVVSYVIVLALAIGMMAIISILSVMNSLQDEIIEELKSIESFHLLVEGLDDEREEDVISRLGEIDNVRGVYPYIETRVILQNKLMGTSVTARMRGVRESLFVEDNPLSSQLSFLKNSDSTSSFNLIMGYSLYSSLGVNRDKNIEISYLGKGKAVSLTLKTLSLPIGGLFYSPLSEFDKTTFFINLDNIQDEIGNKGITYGLYVTHSGAKDMITLKKSISEMFPSSSTMSWQEIHAPFYSALLLEKMLMYLFLLFIFIIVAINIKNSTNRLIHAKERELAILRALGATKSVVQSIIITSSMIITITGVVIGIVLGVVVSLNIDLIFNVLNIIYHSLTSEYNMLFSYPMNAHISAFEISMITLFVLLLSLLFTYGGTRRLLSKEPMEILNHE